MAILKKSVWRLPLLFLLAAGVVLPCLYLFVMIQYGAITLPYWDHIVTVKYIVKYLDGTLTFQDMIEDQSQARPLVPRLIFIANAVLTNWDIRSEYTFIYITLYGAFAALLLALYRTIEDRRSFTVIAAAALISVLSCSPVGAMNHYWSLMLLATLCYFCVIAALLAVSIYPFSWTANISAALLSWAATFSLFQGIFLFPAFVVLHQLIGRRPFNVTRWSVFWLINFAVCSAIYFSGNAKGIALPQIPTFVHFVSFVAVYLGNPLGSLLWFPTMGAIDLLHTSVINAICGIAILGLAAVTAWRALHELPGRRPETLIFITFALYAGACTSITALGRAVGEYPVMSANSSRYSIYAAILLFGLILYYAPKFARGEIIFNGWYKATFGIFMIASAVSYVSAIPVYKSTHDDNIWLANVYGPNAEPTDLDLRAYPDFDYFDPKRKDMLRLGLGPYALVPEAVVPIHEGAFVGAVALHPATTVKQSFKTAHPNLRAITFKVVNWAKPPSSYRILWKAVGLTTGSTIGEGALATAALKDWEQVTLRLNGSAADNEVEVTFSVDAAAVENPIGLALYPGKAQSTAAIADGIPRQDGSVIGFNVNYRR